MIRQSLRFAYTNAIDRTSILSPQFFDEHNTKFIINVVIIIKACLDSEAEPVLVDPPAP